ncbi:MAG: hypothetical protein ACXW3R_13590 [Rhodoplanes sp.]
MFACEVVGDVKTPTPIPFPQGGGEQKVHPRHADMRDDIRASHAVRLGLRQISGFSEEDARAIERVRGAGFDSVATCGCARSFRPR